MTKDADVINSTTQHYYNQSCNVGQHLATDHLTGRLLLAMQHQSQGQERRDLIQLRLPTQRGKGVRGENEWKKKHRENLGNYLL